MVSIRHQNLRLVIYPNDHPPPHTHVLGAGWELRIALSQPPSLMTVLGSPKLPEIAAALLAVATQHAALSALWSKLHG